MNLPWLPSDDDWFVGTWDPDRHDSEDLRVEGLVAQRLSIDWTTRRQQISVSVQNRVVILGGLVNDEQARQVAAELAWDVPGVHDICNTIRVNQRTGRRR